MEGLMIVNDIATQAGQDENLLDATTTIVSAFFSNPNNKIDQTPRTLRI
jgi:hypothetical protein